MQCFHRSVCFQVFYAKNTAKRKYESSSLLSVKQGDTKQLFIEGPPAETKPNYEQINGPLGSFWDKIFLIVFRSKFADQVGIDSKLPQDDYEGLMELKSALNARFSDKVEVQNTAQNVLSKNRYHILRKVKNTFTF